MNVGSSSSERKCQDHPVHHVCAGSLPVVNPTLDSSPPDVSDDVHTINSDLASSTVKAQVDPGSQATTCHEQRLLHDYQAIGFEKYLRDAGGNLHRVVGEGYLKVPSSRSEDKSDMYSMVHCWHTPSMPVVVISPGAIVKRHRKRYYAYSVFSNQDDGNAHLRLCGRKSSSSLFIGMITVSKLTYTHPLVLPSPKDIDVNPESGTDVEDVNVMTEEATRVLWHQRLCHLHDRALSDLHEHVDGIPKIPRSTPVDGCDTCWACKMRKAARGSGDTRADATVVGQGISLDWGFMVQKSKDEERYESLVGINGESSYLLIADHHSDKLWGITSNSKKPPIKWLNRWLAQYKPADCEAKYACMDLGGELAKHTKVCDLLDRHGYSIRPTAPDASWQNSPGERPHQTIGNTLRSMLHGANLDAKFWPYAFNHCLFIHSLVPHGDRGVPHERAGGSRVNVSRLRTFGCRVYVRPPGKRRHRLDNHVNTGIFLGYTATMNNVYYWDLKTKRIKTAVHVKFDEGMNDLETPTPHSRLLRLALGRSLPPEETESTPPQELSLTSSDSPFPELVDVSVPVVCDDHTLGFDIGSCAARDRGYIADIRPRTSGSRLRNWRRLYRGSYIVAVNDKPVFSKDDIDHELRVAHDQADHEEKPILRLTLAPDRDSRPLGDVGSPQMHSDQFRTVVRTLYEMGEGEAFSGDDNFSDDDWDDILHAVVHGIKSGQGSGGISQGSEFTRSQLQRGPDWEEWQQAEWEQLDEMHKCDMYGDPIKVHTLPPDAIILRAVWAYRIKHGGRKKARNCCNGSPLRGKGIQYAKNFAACISQCGMRIFSAITAIKNYVAIGADAVNAYAQSPPPDQPTYVRVDQQYADWYKARYGIQLDPKTDVLPAQHALQGHPEAGALWARKIEAHLADLKFESPVHEPCLYRGTFEGHEIFACRQIDDFMFSGKDEAVVRRLIERLGMDIRLEAEEDVVSHYNGIDFLQTRDYIKMHAQSYIAKILENHGWSAAGKGETRLVEPLHPSAMKELETTEGPENDADIASLEREAGFSYRTALGELIFAYVICRPDIGYAVAELSKFAARPARCHYLAVKRVFRFLRETQHDGLIFWRSEPRLDLPHIELPIRAVEIEEESSFPHPTAPDQLVGYVDAAHANCLRTRRSVGGHVFILAGAAIVYRAKWIPTICTSSTEAEFIAAVSAAKAAKMLRSILQQLGFRQHGSTPIWVDNAAAIMMANAKKPIERSRHIDIQHFALQEWVQAGDVELAHIPGVINPSDALTKALGWVLHRRHCTRFMGLAGSPFATGDGRIVG